MMEKHFCKLKTNNSNFCPTDMILFGGLIPWAGYLALKKAEFLKISLFRSLCKPGSAGQAYVGVHNTILNPDENGIGEIATKSRNVFMGYHRDEVKTKEAFEDGWFK